MTSWRRGVVNVCGTSQIPAALMITIFFFILFLLKCCVTWDIRIQIKTKVFNLCFKFLTLSPPTTYIYVFSVVPLWAQPRIYTWEARRAFFHLENARGKYGCMKHSLCPKNSSLKDDSNDTKNETEKRILPFFMIGQSFVKSIGVFPGHRGTGTSGTSGRERVKETRVCISTNVAGLSNIIYHKHTCIYLNYQLSNLNVFLFPLFPFYKFCLY